MKPIIQAHLNQIEKQKGIRILYACEAGSRAYGLDTEESDYDVRFIFKMPVQEYLKLQPAPKVINDHSVPGIEIQGWDLYKAMHLLGKSNPSLYEWLFSDVVYRSDEFFSGQLREHICSKYSLRKLALHYLQIVKANVKKAIKEPVTISDVKICLQLIRAYLSVKVIIMKQILPPISFEKLLLEGMLPAEAARNTILLQSAKKSGNIVEREICLFIQGFAESDLPFLASEAELLPEGSTDLGKMNSFILKLHSM